jgi:hypothetical protein
MWLSRQYRFVHRYGTHIRWIAGISAALLGPIVDAGPSFHSRGPTQPSHNQDNNIASSSTSGLIHTKSGSIDARYSVIESKTDPELDLEIIGLTDKQQRAIEQSPIKASRDIVGRWWDERPLLGNKMTFYRRDGKVFMENKFDDGAARIVEIGEYMFPNGMRVFTKRPYDGDYYVINANGDLEWWDEDGHFLTSLKAD